MTTAIIATNYIVQPAKVHYQAGTLHGDCVAEGKRGGTLKSIYVRNTTYDRVIMLLFYYIFLPMGCLNLLSSDSINKKQGIGRTEHRERRLVGQSHLDIPILLSSISTD